MRRYLAKKCWSIDFPGGVKIGQNGGKMTGMDKLEFRGMEHPARNNEIWCICVKSEAYGVSPPPTAGPIWVK